MILPKEISTVEDFVSTVEQIYKNTNRVTSIHHKGNYIVFVTVMDGKHIRCHLIPKDDEIFKQWIRVAFEEFTAEPYTEAEFKNFVADYLWRF